METYTKVSNDEEQLELPPGFRFYPTDEELITHYLSQKVVNNYLCARAIGEVDLNKCEPWDLPWKAKMGEKEWYFFCVRERKYPTGLRTNRATDAGYWKATGKDKEIYKGKALVGMKKTLVFHRGRAPKGEKTNWVMHEYRLEGKYSKMYNLPKATENEWVICRIFQKTAAGKKVHISRLSSQRNESKLQPPPPTSVLPPLIDSSPNNGEARTNEANMYNVTCFSNPMEDLNSQQQEDMLFDDNNNKFTSPASLYSASQIPQSIGNLQFQDSFQMSDQSLLRMILENQVPSMKRIDISSRLTHGELVQRSYGGQEDPLGLAASIDLDCWWNYSI